jgi:hypothetical protein
MLPLLLQNIERFLEKNKKVIATAIVVLLLLTGISAILISPPEEKLFETRAATINDILKVTSERILSNKTVVVSDDSPYYAIIATPLAVYYKNKNEKFSVPLLVAKRGAPSSAVTNFLAMYGNPEITMIGDVDAGVGYIGASMVWDKIIKDNIRDASIDVAKQFWKKTDCAILVRNNQAGYDLAVNGASIASYLNIPIIVTDKMDSPLAKFLGELGVAYTITYGEIRGYGATLHISTVEESQDLAISILKNRLNTTINYVTIANPIDVYEPVVLQKIEKHFGGQISDSNAPSYPGAAPVGADGPSHNFDIPVDYEYARLKIDVRMDVSKAKGVMGIGNDADASGERIYIYVGIDGNKDGKIDSSSNEDTLQFFGGSPGYGYIREGGIGRPLYAWFYTEIPFFKDTGAHTIQLVASLPTVYPTYSSEYKVDITIEKLTSSTYPLVRSTSSLASYLAAFRQGVVLAKEDYQLHKSGYIGCDACGEPAANPNVLNEANNRTLLIKNDLNSLLGKIVGKPSAKDKDIIALAEYYQNMPFSKRPHVGIIADTNMIPQYYFKTMQGGGEEGYGMPSDNIYMDIDIDKLNAPMDIGGKNPSFEVPAGRILGWDVQDVSALLARTFFYNYIIDQRISTGNTGILSSSWKSSAMTTVGTEPPVGAARTAADKLNAMWTMVGFDVDSTKNGERSRRQFSEDIYKSSNFMFFAAHGFYYWYVPTAWEGSFGILPPTYGGGAYDVAHVKQMSMGPSIIYGSSCVTGRTDGLYPYNTLSMAFIHAGVNTYIGATRSSWGALFPVPNMKEGERLGDLLGMYFYGNLAGYIYDKHGSLIIKNQLSDTTVGIALMDAKNRYVESEGTDNGGPNDDTFNEFVIYGDPAFNPYEPGNEGSGPDLSADYENSSSSGYGTQIDLPNGYGVALPTIPIPPHL